MAKTEDLSPREQADLDAWAASCPKEIQALLKRVKPHHLYLYKPKNQRGIPISWNVKGTVTLSFTGKFNGPDVLEFERRVFGLNPDDLEECDLPGPGENLGALLTDPADIEAHINSFRAEHGLPPLVKAHAH